jgi:hypothetical protein
MPAHPVTARRHWSTFRSKRVGEKQLNFWNGSNDQRLLGCGGAASPRVIRRSKPQIIASGAASQMAQSAILPAAYRWAVNHTVATLS